MTFKFNHFFCSNKLTNAIFLLQYGLPFKNGGVMEDSKLSAFQRLFDLKCPTKPTQKDALLLRDNIFLFVDDDLVDLKNINPRAYTGWKEFMEDPDIFIGGSVEDEEHRRILNVLIGREEPKLPARHDAQTNLFNPESDFFSDLDVKAIGHRYALERGDEKVLLANTIDEIDAFVSDPASYIKGIDKTSRPKLSDEQIAQLQGLLTELSIQMPPTEDIKPPVAEPLAEKPLATAIPEPNPMANPPAPQAKPPITIPAPATATAPVVVTPARSTVLLNLNVPAWIRRLHAEPRWQTARQNVEQAFKEKNQPLLNAWIEHMQEWAQGCSGPELVQFGEQMLKMIDDLEGGADPTSHPYHVFYINT